MSSRTYLSTLERGLKSPTLEKVDQIAGVLEVHPLTILIATYLGKESYQDVESLLKEVSAELRLVSQS